MFEYEFLSDIIRVPDVEGIRALIKACVNQDVDLTPASVADIARRNRVLVARDASTDGCRRIVGIAVLAPVTTFTETSGRIEQVFIDPRFRGCGIGNEFVRRLTERGSELGFARIEIQTRLRPDRPPRTRRESYIRGLATPPERRPKEPAPSITGPALP